jgi:gluconolactonase
VWLILMLSVGCRAPNDPHSKGTRTTTGTPTFTPTGLTGETGVSSSSGVTGETGMGTGTTAETGAPVDCSLYPPAGNVISTGYITEEDFDFDPRGFMVSQRNQNIEGLDRYGNTAIYATQVGVDASGMRVMSTGDLAIAQPDTGSLVLVDAVTHGKTTVLSGMSFPNALEVDSRGYLFITENVSSGRVRQVDVYTGEQWPVIANLSSPNGVALSPDENTLYVAETGNGGRIMAVDRLSDTEWDIPRVFYTPTSGSFYTIAVDECGNLYIVNFSGGELYRVFADGSGAEFLLDVDNAGFSSFSSIRFGNGVGGWERDLLYVTRRAEFYEVEIGIKGRAPVY